MPATNELTVHKVKSWDGNKLLEWIQQNLTNSLDDEDKGQLSKAKIGREVFLEGAGNKQFFRDAGLSFGASVQLARLAEEAIGKKSKYFQAHCYIRYLFSSLPIR